MDNISETIKNEVEIIATKKEEQEKENSSQKDIGITYIDFSELASRITGYLQFKKKVQVTIRYYNEGFVLDYGNSYIPFHQWNYEESIKNNVIKLYSRIIELILLLENPQGLLNEEVFFKEYTQMNAQEKRDNKSTIQSLINIIKKI